MSHSSFCCSNTRCLQLSLHGCISTAKAGDLFLFFFPPFILPLFLLSWLFLPSLSPISFHPFLSTFLHSAEPVVRPQGQELVASRSVRLATHLLPGISGRAYSAARSPLLVPKDGVDAHDESSLSPSPPSDVSPPVTAPLLIVTTPSPKHLNQDSVSVTNITTSAPPVAQKDEVSGTHFTQGDHFLL